jgi:Raf kinase inhibitor-like YbhB/YbcL family protein
MRNHKMRHEAQTLGCLCLSLAAAIALAGPAKKEPAMSLTLTSPAFSAGHDIPAAHTCDGKNISPPLSWSNMPPAAKSLALIVDDPDAPDPAAPQTPWVHWILYNIPSRTPGLPQNMHLQDLPTGIREGMNGWDRTGYSGPCPPVGKHRYVHKLYALDVILPDLGKPTKARLEKEMRGHVIEQAELIGLYQRGK